MESFHWDRHFITGLSDVDQQHHHLVKIINKFGKQLSDNKIVFNDLEILFKELFDYTQYHFQEEEQSFLVGLDQRHQKYHREAHRNFLQELELLHNRISPDNLNATQHLLNFLINWLAYHILGTDHNMARQIKAIESGLSPSQAYEAEERKRNNAMEPLLAALNALFMQVSMRNMELVQLNTSLEDKVAERTHALSEANLHLKEIALTDVLTGLPNRRYAMGQLEALWNESLQAQSPLVCMMIDADHFKYVNDTYGHNAGDVVLCELAKTLQRAVRTDDIVCRLGGDEFIIICPYTDKNGGMLIAELTRKKISALHVAVGESVWHGSISIGVASCTPDMESHEELLKMADKSVYVAKRDGKNCVRTIS